MKKISLLILTFFCAVGMAIGQKTVSGVVTDTGGEALIGANVYVENTTVGTITDIDGSFSLDVPEGTDVLTVSYTGYQTQEIDITGGNNFDIVLSEGQQLEEIVVTALGLEKDSRKLGYAVETVKASELENSGEASVLNALNSKAAGVTVTSSSGTPGASTNIRVRGSSSITGSNTPLFVVDGVPIDNSSSGNGTGGVANSSRGADLNPNDIESISVLKGAAATAIYGIRAANGVILITTKKGATGAPKVTLNTRFGIDQVNKMPERQNTYAQGRFRGGKLTYRGPETFEGFSWGPKVADLEYDGATDYRFHPKGKLVPKGEGNGTPAETYNPYDFFVNGNTYDINLGVRGGTEKVRYYLSAGRLDQSGVVPNSSWSRNSIRLNTEMELTDRLTAEASANYIQSGGNRPQRGSNLRGVMLGLMRNTPTFDVGNGKKGQAAADDKTTYEFTDGTQRSYRWGIYDNPYWVANKNYADDNVNRIIGHVGLGYELAENLNVKYKLGLDNFSDARLSRIDVVPSPFGKWNPGSIQNINIASTDINSDVILTYGTRLSESIGLDITAGQNYLRERWSGRFLTGDNIAIAGFYNISNTVDLSTSESFSNRDLIGLYGIADFNINEYLFLSGTLRNDWSSTLAGTDNPSFLSYSASLGFAFSELMQDASWLDFGKFRLSYGSNGADAPVFATREKLGSSVVSGDGFIDNNLFPSYGLSSYEKNNVIANPNLKPERTNSFEVGLKMDMFRGRVGFDVTYFNTLSKDLIIPVEVSAASGGTNYNLNAATTSNKGVEILLTTNPVRQSNFRWDLDFNFYKYKNVVEELADGVDNIILNGFLSTSVRAVAGQPYSSIFGSGYQRNDAGQVIIGENGFPLEDPRKRALGDPNPDFTLGVRNSFTLFENLKLSALLDIRQGGDVWCGTCGIINYFGTSQKSADNREKTVVFEGVTQDGQPNTKEVPYFNTETGRNFYTSYGFGGIAEQNIQDGSWVRLREVSLGYSLPKTMLENVGVEAVGVTLSGRNLWLQTAYEGIDPETNLTGDSNGYGLDYFNSPNTKSYNLSLNVTF